MDRYWYVTKRDVVCFQRGRFNLEKIEKIYFYCRRLQKSQNIKGEMGRSQNFVCMLKEGREIEYFPMRQFIEGFTSSLVVNIQLSSNMNSEQ